MLLRVLSGFAATVASRLRDAAAILLTAFRSSAATAVSMLTEAVVTGAG